jgi:CBS domain containing-hemolysin-like protein
LKTVFFPIVWLTSKLGSLVASIFIRKEKNQEVVSDEELEEMIEAIEEEGVIDEDQSELLKNTIDFKETQAYEIMTPRIDMFAIDIDDDIRPLLKDDHIFTHSRIPVYKDTIDNIIGMVPTKLLLKSMLEGKEISSVKPYMYPVKFVPGTMGISEILKDMKKTKNHIVIVKDEFGGTDGLLTMEDILEELVGEMWDETDTVHESYKVIKRNNYEIDGSMNIEEFFELVGVDLPDDIEYTTVGGWVTDMLGRFAKVGDKFSYKNLKIEVLEAEEFTVEKIFCKVIKRRKTED